MIKNHDLLLIVLEKIKDIKTFEATNMNSSREEFACNDLYIKLGLGIVEELVNITNKIDANIILSNKYLTTEIPLLTRYRQALFNPDNSVNAYKLYDFLTYEMDCLYNGITELVNK
jgi:hypothetical protein